MDFEPDHLLNMTSHLRLNTALNEKDRNRADSKLGKMNRTQDMNMFRSVAVDNNRIMNIREGTTSPTADDTLSTDHPMSKQSPPRQEAYFQSKRIQKNFSRIDRNHETAFMLGGPIIPIPILK